MTAGAVIETMALVKRFPRRAGWRSLFRRQEETVALDHVSLAVRPGEVFGLLGANGAGKTTLLKILSTLVLPTSGRAYVAGLDVARHSREVRSRLGVIYGDERTFFWRLSALENLRFYAALYGIPARKAETRIADLLEFTGLERHANLPMHSFSTGMKQRAAIARGLLNEPDILFMDEPTLGLDPLAALELRMLVRNHVADGRRTVLLATNIMSEAEELCHRIAFFTQGAVQHVGAIEQLRGVLRTEDVYVLVVSDVDATTIDLISRVDGVQSVGATPLQGGRLRLEVSAVRGSAPIAQVTRLIVLQGGSVWSSAPQELSLEEMFARTATRSQTASAAAVPAHREERQPVAAGVGRCDEESKDR